MWHCLRYGIAFCTVYHRATATCFQTRAALLLSVKYFPFWILKINLQQIQVFFICPLSVLYFIEVCLTDTRKILDFYRTKSAWEMRWDLRMLAVPWRWQSEGQFPLCPPEKLCSVPCSNQWHEMNIRQKLHNCADHRKWDLRFAPAVCKAHTHYPCAVAYLPHKIMDDASYPFQFPVSSMIGAIQFDVVTCFRFFINLMLPASQDRFPGCCKPIM